MSTKLAFIIEGTGGRSERIVDINRLIIAGWTGRDRTKMEAHVAELEAIGVKRPKTMPTFYYVSASRLTTAELIEVPGETSSGEVETLLINIDGQIFVGLASDHTDRKVEAYSITVSKQMCDKPCAQVLWPFDEVKEHWDKLQLCAKIVENGKIVEYQRGSVAAMLTPMELIRRLEAVGETFAPGAAMLGGTLAAIGGVREAPVFEMSLEDPVLDRSISHRYEIVGLSLGE